MEEDDIAGRTGMNVNGDSRLSMPHLRWDPNLMSVQAFRRHRARQDRLLGVKSRKSVIAPSGPMV